MAVSVTLPQMGESVVEGTIIRWLKKEGEPIEEGEPIVEVSTDKIDTEIPSPASGVLAKILVEPDQTVAVDTEIAVIEDADGAGKGAKEKAAKAGKRERAEEEAPEEEAAEEEAPEEEAAEEEAAEEEQPDGKDAPRKKAPEKKAPEKEPAAARAGGTKEQDTEERTPSARGRARGDGAQPSPDGEAGSRQGLVISPLVRRLARERGVDLEQVQGSGSGGRITKDDVLAASEPEESREPAAAAREPAAGARAARRDRVAPSIEPGEVAFSHVRRAIAEHMTRSLRTSAHVTNFVEVDMTAVHRLRLRARDAFAESEGFSLTPTAFIASAVVTALRSFPEINAHILEDGKTARVFREVNLGIAVGRDEGLIVPVVKGADGLNLVGLARTINDLATRARTKGLRPNDVAGGTFTLSNNGGFGALIDTQVIAQPQVGIMAAGVATKRPAVIEVDGEDMIAIRHLMLLSLTYDHRWVDGHRAAQFNSRVKELLEEADFAADLGLEPAG